MTRWLETSQDIPAGFESGRFRLLPGQRQLLAGGMPVELGGRAFDLLMALIEAPGVVIGRRELMKRVWPDRIVEECNLRAQVSKVRKALGLEHNLIRTVAGRGYQFTGAVRTIAAANEVGLGAIWKEPLLCRPPTNLPEPVSELLGRDEELRQIQSLAATHRLVTVTGAAGIGKTRLAIEVARRMLPKRVDGVWLVELAPLSDPRLVPAAVAAALELAYAKDDISAKCVAEALAAKQLLLVLDTCEHVIDAAASMAEALARANPSLSVIATSREPLRTEAEWIYRVPPLAMPREGGRNSCNPTRFGCLLPGHVRRTPISPPSGR